MSAVIAIVVFWLACVPFAYAAAFAQFQRAWPRRPNLDYRFDRNLAICTSLFGPLALAASALAFGGFPYGLKWR